MFINILLDLKTFSLLHQKFGSFFLELLGHCSIAWGYWYLVLSPGTIIIAAPDYYYVQMTVQSSSTEYYENILSF